MKDKCSGCGLYCKLFMINLTEDEYKSGKYKTQFEKFGLIEDFEKAESCGANIIAQKDDESCIYLKDCKCSIHKIRPKSCRAFFCASKDSRYKDMISRINKHKNPLPL